MNNFMTADSESMNHIDVETIARVYSGKPGCMCGCKGKYRIASKFVAQFLAKRPKHDVTGEVNDAQVKRVVNVLNTHGFKNDEPGIYYAEVDGRNYVAYTIDEA